MKYIFVSLFVATVVFAAEKHEHRQHEAHVHGLAQVNIAFDGLQGSLEIHSPAESILGFEHMAKSIKDKKIEAEKLTLLENKIGELVAFEGKLKCLISKANIKIEHEGSHADIDADFKVQCASSPLGSKVTFHLQKYFPNLRQVEVTVLAGALQKAAKVTEDGFELGLN